MGIGDECVKLESVGRGTRSFLCILYEGEEGVLSGGDSFFYGLV